MTDLQLHSDAEARFRQAKERSRARCELRFLPDSRFLQCVLDVWEHHEDVDDHPDILADGGSPAAQRRIAGGQECSGCAEVVGAAANYCPWCGDELRDGGDERA